MFRKREIKAEKDYRILRDLIEEYFSLTDSGVDDSSVDEFGQRVYIGMRITPRIEFRLRTKIAELKDKREEALFEQKVRRVIDAVATCSHDFKTTIINIVKENQYDDKKSVPFVKTSGRVCGSSSTSEQTDAVRTGRDSEGAGSIEQTQAASGSERLDCSARVARSRRTITDSDGTAANDSGRIEKGKD
jgi:hypothetical protein